MMINGVRTSLASGGQATGRRGCRRRSARAAAVAGPRKGASGVRSEHVAGQGPRAEAHAREGELEALRAEVATLRGELARHEADARVRASQLERYAADLREIFKQERARAQELRALLQGDRAGAVQRRRGARRLHGQATPSASPPTAWRSPAPPASTVADSPQIEFGFLLHDVGKVARAGRDPVQARRADRARSTR